MADSTLMEIRLQFVRQPFKKIRAMIKNQAKKKEVQSSWEIVKKLSQFDRQGAIIEGTVVGPANYMPQTFLNFPFFSGLSELEIPQHV